MNSSSDELKSYVTKIVAAVATAVVLYGIFYIIDSVSSFAYLYEVIPFIWLVFRLFLAAVVIYVGVMAYKVSRSVLKMSGSYSKKIMFPRKRVFSLVLLMMICISIPVVISRYVPLSLTLVFRPYSGQLVYEEWLAGYFGYADDYSYKGVQILDAIDLQTLSARAEAREYDVIRGNDTTTYYYADNKTYHYIRTPKVAIRHIIILEEKKSVTFTVTAYNEGFVKINVESKYFLNTHWIRGIFAQMFFDIGLPTAKIWRYTIIENWIGTVANACMQ